MTLLEKIGLISGVTIILIPFATVTIAMILDTIFE